MFMLQTGVTIATAANFPLACTSDGSSCLFFSLDTMRNNELGGIISNQVDTSQYKSTQIQADITTDTFTATAVDLNTFTNIAYMTLFGGYTFIVFVFGSNIVGILLAGAVQTMIYIFYARAFLEVIKLGGRGEM